MANRVNITEAMIGKLKPPAKGRLTIRDAKIPGLLLVVTMKGAKSWYLYKWHEGRPRRFLLGHHSLMTVDDARKTATKKAAGLIDGIDPTAEKRLRRRSGITLGDVFDHFTTNKSNAHSRPSTAVAHKSRYDTCLACWKGRRLDSIRKAEVIELHVRLGDERGHVTANRAIQLLRALFNHAADKMGVQVANPAARVEMFREVPRKRYLTEDEIPRFFKALDAEPDETFRDFFKLCLFSGQRRGNVQSMRWADVDFKRKTWTIPAEQFKTGRALTVPLSAEAMEILDRRKQYAVNAFVFSSHGESGHLVEPKGAWERLRAASGLKDLRIHDLRHTLASWQVNAGTSLAIVGKGLGHARPETTQRYAHLQLDPVRESVAAATAAMAAAGKAKEGAK